MSDLSKLLLEIRVAQAEVTLWDARATLAGEGTSEEEECANKAGEADTRLEAHRSAAKVLIHRLTDVTWEQIVEANL